MLQLGTLAAVAAVAAVALLLVLVRVLLLLVQRFPQAQHRHTEVVQHLLSLDETTHTTARPFGGQHRAVVVGASALKPLEPLVRRAHAIVAVGLPLAAGGHRAPGVDLPDDGRLPLSVMPGVVEARVVVPRVLQVPPDRLLDAAALAEALADGRGLAASRAVLLSAVRARLLGAGVEAAVARDLRLVHVPVARLAVVPERRRRVQVHWPRRLWMLAGARQRARAGGHSRTREIRVKTNAKIGRANAVPLYLFSRGGPTL